MAFCSRSKDKKINPLYGLLQLDNIIDETNSSASPSILPIEKPAAENTPIKLQRHFIPWKPSESAPDIEDDEEGLYNPLSDEKDALYVNAKYRFGAKTTDAILCCPGCFTPVCYQCQRHERYTTQYRAVTSVNCITKTDILLTFPEISLLISEQYETHTENLSHILKSTQSTTTKEIPPPATPSLSESRHAPTTHEDAIRYHPVECKECHHTLAFLEAASHIYHFFDVLPGEA